MQTIKSEYVRTDETNKDWWMCAIVSPTDPDSLELSGADVDGVPDAAGLAAGSILITPTANYIAFEDGVFTAKGEGGGGGGGGAKNGLLSFDISPELNPDPAFSTLYPIYWENLTDEDKELGVTKETTTTVDVVGKTYDVTVTPTSEWYVLYFDGEDSAFSNKGEAATFSVTPGVDREITFALTNGTDWDAPDYVEMTVYIKLYLNA